MFMAVNPLWSRSNVELRMRRTKTERIKIMISSMSVDSTQFVRLVRSSTFELGDREGGGTNTDIALGVK